MSYKWSLIMLFWGNFDPPKICLRKDFNFSHVWHEHSWKLINKFETNSEQENTRQIDDLIGGGIKFKICWTNEQLILWEKELTWLGSAVYCTLCWYVNLNMDWKPSTFPLPAKDLPKHFQDTVQKFMYVKLFVQCVFFSIGNTDSNNKYENTLC